MHRAGFAEASQSVEKTLASGQLAGMQFRISARQPAHVAGLIRPAVATVIIFNGIGIWNDFFLALVFLYGSSKETLSIAVYQFVGDDVSQWNLIMATAMLALLPPALVVVLMQKWFVKGLVETEK